MNNLTKKQQLFVHYYCQHWNGKKAAIEAGYSENCATEQANENLTKPHIKKAVERQFNELIGVIDVDAETIAKELEKIAFANPDDEDTNLRYGDKIKSLELLGKYHQMFTEKMQVTTTMNDIYNDIIQNASSHPKSAIKANQI